MKLWILSDLHIRRQHALTGLIGPEAIPEADVAVLAGDITEGAVVSLGYLARTISLRMPAVVVLGNHEFYGEEYGRARQEAAKVARMVSGLHLLDDSAAVVGGVRFVGGTLWTDYSLYARSDQAGVRQAMSAAGRQLSDHTQIEVAGPAAGVMSKDWSPRNALGAHRQTVAYLDRVLAHPHDGPTVVVTHHAPHPLCVAPRFRGHVLTPAFVSDLSDLIFRRSPQLWIHGHVHDPVDVHVGKTRIVCNPRGYAGEGRSFDPRLVLEI